jgi:hypothetical protein
MSIYANPRFVDKLENCYFYHTMDLPGIGKVEGNWDMQGAVGEYLGHTAFSGKRVLDVGCASGILSFHMERSGAEVVSYDLDKGGDWDMVPFAKWEHYAHIANERKSIIDRLNNAYWLAHRLYASNAKVVYGNVYEIPEQIGPVDISVFGAILLHLRDPFQALRQALRLTRETVIVTEQLRGPLRVGEIGEPALGFLPDFNTVEPKDTWWNIPPAWVIQAVGVLGFENARVTYHTKKYDGKENQLYTVVANRRY